MKITVHQQRNAFIKKTDIRTAEDTRLFNLIKNLLHDLQLVYIDILVITLRPRYTEKGGY